MTYATDTFTGDGSTVEFTLTFDYIERDHVEVTRIVTATKARTTLSVIQTGTPTGDQYIWETDTKIKVGTAPTSAQELTIVRDTPEDEQIVEWADGSYIVATDLNTADQQFLYGIQELEDKVEALDGGSTGGAAVKGVTGTAPITVDNTDPQNPIIGSDAVTTVTGVSPISVDLTDPQKPEISSSAVTAVTGTTPVSIDSSNPQQPDVSVDAITKAQAESDPTNPSWDTDDKLASAGAIDRVFKQVVGNGAGFPGSGNKAKDGQLRVDNTGLEPELYYWDASLGSPAWVEIQTEGPQGPKGDTGSTGPAGPAPGLQSPAATATSVSLNSDGTVGTPTVSVTKDSSDDLKFDFGIPIGQRGPKGDTGSGVTYKGLIDAVTAAEPTSPDNGDFYVSSAAGTSSWAGTVLIGSRIVYNGGTSSWDTYDPVASQTLQQVTDLDNFTTTDIAIGNTAAAPKIELKNDGTAIFNGLVESKSNGFKFPDGTTQTTAATTPATSTLQEVTDAGNFTDNDIDIGGTSGSPNIQLEATGAATFEGRLEADQGSFNADVGIIGESGTDTAFFVRDAGQTGSPTTFSVTAEGEVKIGGTSSAPNLKIFNNGSIAAAGNSAGSNVNGYYFTDDGRAFFSSIGSATLWQGYTTGTTSPTSTIKADGTITAIEGVKVEQTNQEVNLGNATPYAFHVKQGGTITASTGWDGTITAHGINSSADNVIDTGSMNVYQSSSSGASVWNGGWKANVGGIDTTKITTTIDSDGSITAAGTFQIDHPTDNSEVTLSRDGTLDLYRATTNNNSVIRAYTDIGSTKDLKFEVKSDGSITADGTFRNGGFNYGAGSPGNQLAATGGVFAIKATQNYDSLFHGRVGTTNKFVVDAFGDITTVRNVTASGALQTGGDARSGTAMGIWSDPTGTVSATTNSGSGSLWEGYTTGNSSATSMIKANGNITAKGKLSVDVNAGFTTGCELTAGTQSAFTAFSSSSLNTNTQKFVVYEGDTGITKAAITAGGAATFEGKITASGTSGHTFFSANTVFFAKSGTTNFNDYLFYGENGATSASSGGTVQIQIHNNGDIKNTNNSYTGISDVKLKENIVDASSQWDDIKALRIRNYNFKEETGYNTHKQLGLVAQELEPICPKLVNESIDLGRNGERLETVTKSINYSVLYMKAVKGLQEAMERIETLEAEVNALKAAASS